MHNYENSIKHYPPNFCWDATDEQGPRLVRLRTAVLPYLEEQNIYQFVDFSLAYSNVFMPDGTKLMTRRTRCCCPSEVNDRPSRTPWAIRPATR